MLSSCSKAQYSFAALDSAAWGPATLISTCDSCNQAASMSLTCSKLSQEAQPDNSCPQCICAQLCIAVHGCKSRFTHPVDDAKAVDVVHALGYLLGCPQQRPLQHMKWYMAQS